MLLFVLYAQVISAPHLVPYGLIIIPLFDFLSGGDITRLDSEGITWEYAMESVPLWRQLLLRFYMYQVTERRVLLGRYSTDPGGFRAEETYNSYFDLIRRLVPPQDRMEWDMRKNTCKEFCDFMGLRGPALCKEEKPLEKVAINVM